VANLPPFWQWLREQRDRENPVGDLARNAIDDYKRGHRDVRSVRDLRSRIDSIGSSCALKALHSAPRERRHEIKALVLAPINKEKGSGE
jgi:hypothetical protein